MSTDTFNIVLQKGIQGGFAPPIPDARYILSRNTSNPDIFIVSIQTRPHGTPQLLSPQTRELKVADHAAAIARLQELLRDIPPQYPGAQDLYGRDTSILTDHITVGALQMSQMSGSQAGIGISLPTEEQKAKFDEAVKIIQSFGA